MSNCAKRRADHDGIGNNSLRLLIQTDRGGRTERGGGQAMDTSSAWRLADRVHANKGEKSGVGEGFRVDVHCSFSFKIMTIALGCLEKVY